VGDPHAIALAAAAGHADVVRLLMGKWQGAETDEAYTAALLLGHASVIRQLEGRSRLVSSGWLLALVPCLDIDVVKSVVLERGLTEDGMRLLAAHPSGRAVIRRLAALNFATRESAEFYLREFCWEFVPREVVPQLRSMGVRPGYSGIRQWSHRRHGELVELFGPFASWNEDPFYVLGSWHWADLVKAGVPLRWSRYADEAEHLRALDRNDITFVSSFFDALKAHGIPLSRHCYCDGPSGCPCGYRRHLPYGGLQRAHGATPCSQRGTVLEYPLLGGSESREVIALGVGATG
jgi:hypothetical protein